MNEVVLNIGGRDCVIFRGSHPRVLLIQPTDAHDRGVLPEQVRLLEQRCGEDFLLAAFPVADWNRELSPWDAPAVFGNADFGHGAAETLRFIEQTLLPTLNQEFQLSEALPVILGGYSLAGLFALWSGCETDRFSAVAAASPSVWFPGWVEYAQQRDMRAKQVYLSLGDKEEKTKNPVMARVGDCIRRQAELLQSRGIDCTLEWNAGGHFKDSEKRTAAAFAWCVERNGLAFHRATEAEKSEIAAWRYDGDYAIYNMEPYETQRERGVGLANPQNHFFAFYDGDRLIGFTNLYEEEMEVFFGIGVHPACCGRGYGQQMTLRTLELSRSLFPGKPLYLEVRTWNKRAVACYEKAGFRIVGDPIVQATHLGEGTFYRMTAEA